MSVGKWNLTTGFFWLGFAMSLASFALVLAGNTELVWRLEHRGLPQSWVFGGAAMLAFLAAEFCHSAFSFANRAENRDSQRSPEWEVAETISE